MGFSQGTRASLQFLLHKLSNMCTAPFLWPQDLACKNLFRKKKCNYVFIFVFPKHLSTGSFVCPLFKINQVKIYKNLTNDEGHPTEMALALFAACH